jgi:PIN domain nuclease of toxin-antitoxin system
VSALLLDTHVWAWSLSEGARLSKTARRAIKGASVVLVSPISIYEIAQKVRMGKWPEMEPSVDRLHEILAEQGGLAADMRPEICLAAGLMDWVHLDPFDRLILATALTLKVPLVSADPVFDGRVERVW